jgi:hypothetical protein
VLRHVHASDLPYSPPICQLNSYVSQHVRLHQQQATASTHPASAADRHQQPADLLLSPLQQLLLTSLLCANFIELLLEMLHLLQQLLLSALLRASVIKLLQQVLLTVLLYASFIKLLLSVLPSANSIKLLLELLLQLFEFFMRLPPATLNAFMECLNVCCLVGLLLPVSFFAIKYGHLVTCIQARALQCQLLAYKWKVRRICLVAV